MFGRKESAGDTQDIYRGKNKDTDPLVEQVSQSRLDDTGKF